MLAQTSTLAVIPHQHREATSAFRRTIVVPLCTVLLVAAVNVVSRVSCLSVVVRKCSTPEDAFNEALGRFGLLLLFVSGTGAATASDRI